MAAAFGVDFLFRIGADADAVADADADAVDGACDGVFFVFFANKSAAAFGVNFRFRPDDLDASVSGRAFLDAGVVGGAVGASFSAGASFVGAFFGGAPFVVVYPFRRENTDFLPFFAILQLFSLFQTANYNIKTNKYCFNYNLLITTIGLFNYNVVVVVVVVDYG